MKNKKLSKNSTLAEILKIRDSEKILARHQVPCLSCSFATYEMRELTLGEIAKIYQLDLQAILKELNQLINA